jgi:thioredoxin-like negative regulator of GroEL
MPPRSSRPLVLAFSALVAVAGCGRRIGEVVDEHDGGAATTITPTSSAPARAPSTQGWNAAQIAWQPYEAGLQQAKAQNKPVCLVFSTTWCPHCKNYSHVFEDPRVVAHAQDFVMIHLDSDAEELIASRYAIDGSYIPRTFFLTPDGKVDDSIHAPRPTSRYFYDEHDPSSLLAAMDTARRKLIN